MNQSNWQLFYEKIGSPTIITDSIQLFFFMPFSSFGIISNLLVTIILSNKTVFKEKIYNHIKIYSVSNMFMCLVVFSFAFVHIPRYASFSYSYPARVFSCAYMLPLMLISYSNILIVTILGMIYRLSKFVIKFRAFENINFNKTGCCAIIWSILSNLTLFFRQTSQSQTKFDVYKNDTSKLHSLKLCIATSFGQTSIAQTLFVVIFAIDYILLSLIEMAFIFISLYYYKRFLMHKFDLSNLITMNKILKTQFRENELRNDEKEPVEVYTKTAIFISILYVFSDVVLIILGFLIITKSDRSTQIYNYSFQVLNFILVSKHGFIIFILYKFDTNFKSYVNNLFR
jgi:hypothetical protein